VLVLETRKKVQIAKMDLKAVVARAALTTFTVWLHNMLYCVAPHSPVCNVANAVAARWTLMLFMHGMVVHASATCLQHRTT
jgi:hypothetical protein